MSGKTALIAVRPCLLAAIATQLVIGFIRLCNAAETRIHQLRKLPRFNARRAEIAALYGRELAGIRGLGLPGAAPYPHVHPWHLFTVLAPDRAEFMDRLKSLGIGTGLHFEAVHLHAYYRERYGYRPGAFPVAEEVCARIVSLPLFPSMTDDDARDVVAAVREVVERAAA